MVQGDFKRAQGMLDLGFGPEALEDSEALDKSVALDSSDNVCGLSCWSEL